MIKVLPSVFNGVIQAPASRGYAQRLLFAAALSNKPTVVRNVPACEDMEVTLECLKSFGCKITTEGQDRWTVKVEPFVKTTPLPTVDLNFIESGTTSRFAIAVCAAMGMRASCRASGNLPKRSLVEMTSRLALRGVTFSNFSFPLKMQSKLRGGEFAFSGDEGAQFVSALLMALPLLRDDSDIKLEGPISDRSFIDITIRVMEDFGVFVDETETGFHIPGRQVYETPGELMAENDWSLASLWLFAGSASAPKGGRVTVTGLQQNSPQKYRDVISAFALMAQPFEDINIDASSFPNMATVFAALAAVRGSPIRINGVPQLKFMETDRLVTMGHCVEVLGTKFAEEEDCVFFEGDPNKEWDDSVAIDTKGDPWIFMSLVIAAATAGKTLVLKDEDAAKKIYAPFLDDYESLGGKYEII